MAWKPIQPRQSGLSPAARNLISRGTMICIALLLLFGSFRTLRFVSSETEKALQEQTKLRANGVNAGRRVTGLGLPTLLGFGMGALGLIIGSAAVVPVSFYDRFVSPPGDPHDEADQLKRAIRGRW